MGLSPAQTKMGVAIAKHPLGPYVKHKENPVIKAGHEVLVWPEGKGITALISANPKSIWHSEDGIRFKMVTPVNDRPNAPGAYRPDAFLDTGAGKGIEWGISMIHHKKWPYLVRFTSS
jgi:hypothetical protein